MQQLDSENILNKLNESQNNDDYFFKNWNIVELKNLLDIYYIICKKEKYIYELIYSFHGCDSWEDIFRDYDENILNDKAIGVEIALKEIEEQITNKK